MNTDHPHTGKWIDPTFPKEGWSVVPGSGFDRGHDGMAPCEVCEVEPVRYAIVIEHPNYFEYLYSGCVCCSILVGDPSVAARTRKRIETQARRLPGFKARPYNKKEQF